MMDKNMFYIFLCVICYHTTTYAAKLQSQPLTFTHETEDSEWDHFVYTQQWPPSVCVNPAEHQCKINDNVTTWTVHGLWPNEGAELKPCYCNSTWKFNPDQIKPIFDQLLEYWPNLFYTSPSTEFDFWKHEWAKHGTCAASKPELDSELKYFQMGLKLRNLIDIGRALKDRAIAPSNTTEHKVADVEKALQDRLGNNSYKIECEYFGNPKKQYLKQVEVCLTKDTYRPMPCPAKTSRRLTSTLRDDTSFGKSCKFATSTVTSSQPDAADLQRCAGDPNYCKCLDTLIVPEYNHRRR